ncbi:hypothetical protein HPB50_011662 [Hyalomma asiaticum]|uniref:Uncharacterized protein n=1 Tax=Hyalomma asiaticum TaxID=266040 RepID=A0ACB7RIZ4_HYAAI|nr:hypothetical protein HPB50_011662 [Hyalomma asiaticum]
MKDFLKSGAFTQRWSCPGLPIVVVETITGRFFIALTARPAASTACCEVSADVRGSCPVWITCWNGCRMDEYWQLMEYT